MDKTSSPSISGGGGGTSGGRPGRPVDLPRPKTRMDTPSNNNNVHQIVKAQIVFLLSTLTEENFEQNLKLVNVFADVAKQKGCTAGQLAIAWVLAQGRVSTFELRGWRESADTIDI